MLAERQQRAERLDHGVARIRRRLAVVVDQRARLERDRPCCRRRGSCPARSCWSRSRGRSARSPGRGMPTQNGLVPMRASRPPNGATIGRDSTLTKWIDTRPCVDALLGPVADPAEVVRMGQADDADAVLPWRALDAELHRLVADHLAVALAAVEREQRAAVLARIGDVGVDARGRLRARRRRSAAPCRRRASRGRAGWPRPGWRRPAPPRRRTSRRRATMARTAAVRASARKVKVSVMAMDSRRAGRRSRTSLAGGFGEGGTVAVAGALRLVADPMRHSLRIEPLAALLAGLIVAAALPAARGRAEAASGQILQQRTADGRIAPHRPPVVRPR